MQRTQISLTDEERKLLDREAERSGRSIASLIREAVRRTYGRERSAEEDLTALRQGFGAWRDHEEDGATYVERMRSGRRLREVLGRP